MTDLPLHPALVHLPLGVAIVAPILALAALIMWRSGRLARPVWWLVVGLQVLAPAGAYAALLTGEEEEERVEDFVDGAAIHEHEEAAEAFLISSAVVLALMVAAGLWKDERLARGIAGAAIVGGLVSAGLAMNAGHLGGKLVFVHGAGGAPIDAGAVESEEDGD